MNDISFANLEISDFVALCPEASTLRVAPGYLFLPGLFEFLGGLGEVSDLRLLIANDTFTETLEQVVQRHHRHEPMRDEWERRQYVSRPMTRTMVEATTAAFRRGLELLEQTEENQRNGLKLLTLLEGRRACVKLHLQGSFSARAYLVERDGQPVACLFGSRNLFLPSPTEPTNRVLIEDRPEALRDLTVWFDRLWVAAEDVTGRLADQIRRSWIGGLISPYDLYLKTLHSLVRDRLDYDSEEVFADEDVHARLADFQRAAFRQAIQIIREFGGVFVADVVGLGKSFIGAAILKHFEVAERVRPLIVCPAPLVEMWERYNEKFNLNAQVVSSGILRRSAEGHNPLLDGFRYRDRDFVLIDESHSFRNPGTQRYKILQEYMAQGQRRACLLTATPRNRSAWDIYHQIKLFHPSERIRVSLPISPPDLTAFFREVERGRSHLPEILRYLLIRRTRGHVLRFYGRDSETNERLDPQLFSNYRDGGRRAYVLVDGRRQFFPRRTLKTIEYSIEATYEGLYERIRHCITRPDPASSVPSTTLRFARYNLWGYLIETRRGAEEYGHLHTASAGLHGLVRVLLFKRFESSVHAFRESVRRMVRTHESVLVALRNEVVPAGEEAEGAMNEFGPDDEAALLDALQDAAGRYPASDFDMERLTRDVTHDLSVLREISSLVEPIQAEQDQKLQTLRTILSQPPLNAGKVLVFTQFTDTARYLGRYLSSLDRPGSRVVVLTSAEKNKSSVIGCFAPHANPDSRPADSRDEIGLLIATDVVSEGMNLQDGDKIINYDLHWNPVRLIQRFGRVDRIGSDHDEIFGFNFLPEAGLENQLGLRAVLRLRILEIHATIGEDASILEPGEQLNEEAMYAIYANGQMTDEEEETDDAPVHLADAEEILRRLRETDPVEFARIAAIPDGVRSACWSKSEGLFTFCQAGEYRELSLRTRDGRVLTTEVPRILGMLKCDKETPIAHFERQFDELLQKAFREFSARASDRHSEREEHAHLSAAQRYILRELREYTDQCPDAVEKSQIDQMEKAYREPQSPVVKRELSRLRRDGLDGAQLVQNLRRIYHTYGLRHLPLSSDSQNFPSWPALICGEAFVQPLKAVATEVDIATIYKEDQPA